MFTAFEELVAGGCSGDRRRVCAHRTARIVKDVEDLSVIWPDSDHWQIGEEAMAHVEGSIVDDANHLTFAVESVIPDRATAPEARLDRLGGIDLSVADRKDRLDPNEVVDGCYVGYLCGVIEHETCVSAPTDWAVIDNLDIVNAGGGGEKCLNYARIRVVEQGCG